MKVLVPKGNDKFELKLEVLGLLLWEHRQYCEAQEFAESTVQTLRVMQDLSESMDRIFSSDIQSHPAMQVEDDESDGEANEESDVETKIQIRRFEIVYRNS